MYCVLEPLGEPVGNKGDVGNEARNFGVATSSIDARFAISSWRILDVDGSKGDSKPGGIRRADEPSEKADHVDMAVVVSDVDRSLEHEGAKRYAFDPGNEGNDHDNDEDEKDYAASIVLFFDHVDGSAQAPKDV